MEEALKLDAKNGNDLWRKGIEKEMTKMNKKATFEKYEKATADELRSGKKKIPGGYNEMTCHMVFDIKMDGLFTRKARYVADGHTSGYVPGYLTYSSVVTRESVRIAFLYAALNELDILSCDVTNAYLNAPCKEKLWVQGGKEFGGEAGEVFIIRKAIYGLKSSGFSWRQMLSQSLMDLKFECTIADADVYRRRAAKRDGTLYYELLMTYVDDIIIVSANPKEPMDKLNEIYEFGEEAKPPERYLGANITQWQLPDGKMCWAMSGKDYVKNAVNIVKDLLAKDGRTLRTGKSAMRPTIQSYRPELDISAVLGADMSSRFQQLIGILRWAVELGRVDILTEVSLLSQYLCQPREGHLEGV